MGEGKKTLDKGIAYLKKNGPAAALKRAARKAALLKEPDYQKWYAKQKRAMEKEAARANVQTAAVRRIAPDGEIRETDEYLLFLDADTSADAWAEQIYAQAACSHPRTELFYCDSDSAQTPFCKPDFDRWFLYSANYIGSGYLASAALARRAGEPAGLYKADGAGKYWIQDKGYPRQPFSGIICCAAWKIRVTFSMFRGFCATGRRRTGRRTARKNRCLPRISKEPGGRSASVPARSRGRAVYGVRTGNGRWCPSSSQTKTRCKCWRHV